MVVADSKMPKKRSNDMVEQSQLTATPKLPEKSMEEMEEEDEEEEEIEDSDASDAEDTDGDDETLDQPSKKARLEKAELYKPPTNEELNRLRETENLYQSSLFRLQMTELLAEVMIKEKKKKVIEGYISQLRTFLISLDPGEAHQLADTSWLTGDKLKLPLQMAPPSNKGTFQFLPPTEIKQIGSYPLGICLKPKPAVDIGVEMPKACFQQKDNLNQRYFRKRALYLTCLAQRLRLCDLVEEMHFTYHLGNSMRPILVLKPKVVHGQGFVIHLHLYPEEGSLSLSRFHLNKNNVRRKWYKQQSDEASEGLSESVEPGTPQYNTWVLQDLARDNNQAYTEHMLGNHQGIRDGLALLKVWLHQRQLDQGPGCFHGYVMTMYVVYLLAKRKLNPMMSGYQVLRNTLLFFSQSDWTTEGICLASASQCGPDRPLIVDFHQTFDVVFVDRTGYLNLCADVLKVTWQRVQHEASLSIQHMNQPATDCFHILFMMPIKFTHKFDQCFHIKPTDLYKACADQLVSESAVMDRCGDVISLCVPKLVTLLYKALGGRVQLLGYQLNITSMWGVDDSPPVSNDVTLTFGLLINQDEAYNVLQKGPSADTQEATEFREFWGEKSELRRFQDASICEAVLWSCKSVAGKRNIVSQVIKHVLNRHAKLPAEAVTFLPSPLDSLLRLPHKQTNTSPVYGTGEEQTLHVHRCYDDLSKKLRTLRDLPLTIQTIQGLSPVFRDTEVFPPIPVTKLAGVQSKDLDLRCPDPTMTCPPWTDAIQVLCMLESSGKWPDDKEAVQRVKAAFLLKIQQMLMERHKLVCHMTASHLDVFMEGFVFRIEIGCKKEISLHKMVKTPEGMVKMVNTETAQALEHHIMTLPTLTSMLHGLQQQHGTYSPTVRLVKRWLSAHMLLDGYISDEAIELIVAHLYISPEPYTKPCSPLVGFLRFLSLLSTHDWQKVPLVVNLNNKLTNEDYTEIQTRFTRDRVALPLMYIATSLDKHQSRCTRGAPTPQILNRMMLLATESLGVLQTQLTDISGDVDFKQVFRPPLESYDVIIRLNYTQLARQHYAVDITKRTILPPYEEYDSKSHPKCLPITQFDPVICYLKELRDTYGELAMFFHDTYGGSMIAVVWKLAAFKPVTFKASHINCRRVSEMSSKETLIAPNVEAIMEGFRVIGRGLVKNIEARTDKWTI